MEATEATKPMERHDAMLLFDLLVDDSFDVAVIASTKRDWLHPEKTKNPKRIFELRVTGHDGLALTPESISRVLRLAGECDVKISGDALVLS